MSTYKIVINHEIMDEYGEVYKRAHPRSRKHPFANKTGNVSVIPNSLNKWMVMLRAQANNEKQKWKEFIVWLIEKNGLTNKQIKKAIITFVYYFPTKLRRDADNYTPKNIMDGFTESGLLIDDDFSHIEELRIKGGYDKENPRTEIYIEEM